jgi:hypothetical protein
MKFFSAAAAAMVFFSSVVAHPVGAEEGVEIFGKTEASIGKLATIAQFDAFESCTKQTSEEECNHADPGPYHECNWQQVEHCDTFECVLVKKEHTNCEIIDGEYNCNHEDECVWLERIGDKGVCDKIKDQVDECSSRITDKDKCNSILGCAWFNGRKRGKDVCGHAPRHLQCVSQRLNTNKACWRAGCSWKWDDWEDKEAGEGNCIGRWERRVFKSLKGFPSDEAKSIIRKIFREELYRFKEEQSRRDGQDLIKLVLDKDNCLKKPPAFEDIE